MSTIKYSSTNQLERMHRRLMHHRLIETMGDDQIHIRRMNLSVFTSDCLIEAKR
ncbi:MAG TPA: hypothetical protein VFT72_01730 [Opitutaceae bacterium]|nr:hypothetical protein [Opitutaceae bacterium]